MIIATRDKALTVQARSFASLMELYEDNYIFMRRLVPALSSLSAPAVSQAGGVDLHLSLLERSPYTTTLSLTHRFPGAEASPDLVVRIYHDARSAEVLPGSSLTHLDPRNGRALAAGSLGWRWEVNRFLHRWLRYCLGEGHQFAAQP